MRGAVHEAPSWVVTANATNATAAATKADPGGDTSHYVTGVAGGFSATVSGATITLKQGTTTLAVWRVYNSLSITFPSPIEIAKSTVCSLELSAGGSTVVGNVTMTGYTI